MLPSIRIWYEADGDYDALFADLIEEGEEENAVLGEETIVEDTVVTFGTDAWFGF